MSWLRSLVLFLCWVTETTGWLMVYAGMIALGAVIVAIAIPIGLAIIMAVIIYSGTTIILLSLWAWIQQGLGGD